MGGPILRVSALPGLVPSAAWLFASTLAWAQADPALIAKGEKVYTDKKCALCHMIKGKGGKSGGDLSTVGAKREVQWLKTFMRDPRALVPKGKMLPFKGSDEELEAVVAYLRSLR